MSETTETRMARLEEKVSNLGANVEKGFQSVDKKLNNIDSKLETVSKIYLSKEEYYKDIAESKAAKAPWMKTALAILTNVLSFITLALVAYILANGSDIFK